jgi:hypothetical protein
MKEQQVKNEALKIAEEIFSNGRIEDPEDWNEMEIELSFEMSERDVPIEDRDLMRQTVKKAWYSNVVIQEGQEMETEKTYWAKYYERLDACKSQAEADALKDEEYYEEERKLYEEHGEEPLLKSKS